MVIQKQPLAIVINQPTCSISNAKMRKFFKLGSKKSNNSPTNGRRRSLGSFGSAEGTPLSSPSSSGWGSVIGLNSALWKGGYTLDPNKDKDLTKLHKACWIGDLEKVKKYVQKTDVNLKDSENRTPLHLAVVQAHKDIIWFLLGYKAQPNLPDSDGNTPLIKAVQCHHKEIVQFLLERGADPKCYNNNGDTSLHVAVVDHLQDIALSLIGKGANINAQNKFGMTPLMMATTHGHIELAELFLRHGASVNTCSKAKKNCLMLACEEGLTEFVQLFLRHEVNLSLKNDMGLTAEEISNISGHEDCATIIRTFRLRRDSFRTDANLYDSPTILHVSHIAVLSEYENVINDETKPPQVDTDLSDGELESWNDASIATTSSHDLSKEINKNENQQAVACGVDLSKFFLSSGKTDAILCHEKNDILNSNMALSSSSDANQDANDETKSTEAYVPVDNFQKDEKDLVRITSSKNCAQKDKDVLAELGLSDISEVSTPSDVSLKSVQSKDVEMDAKDKDINDSKSNGFHPPQAEICMSEGGDVLNFLSKLVDNSKSRTPHEETEPVELLKQKILDSRVYNVDNFSSAISQHQDGVGISGASSHASIASNCASTQNLKSSCKENVNDSVNGAVKDELNFNEIAKEKLYGISDAKQKPLVGLDSDSDWDENSHDDDVGAIHMRPVIMTKTLFANSTQISNRRLQESKTMNPVMETETPSNPLGKVSHESNGICIDEIVKSNTKATVSSLQVQLEGTLGRSGTLQETEEIWESNPCVELPALLPCKLDADDSNLSKSNDMENSEKSENFLAYKEKLDTEKGDKPNDEFHTEEPKMWEHLWLQICGRHGPENYCDSEEEISASIHLTEEENKDGFNKEATFQDISSADDQSSLSLHGDQCYKLLAIALKDPVNIGRVVDMVQHLKLAWKDSQHKNNVMSKAVALLKIEVENLRIKASVLNGEKVEVANKLSQLKAELESVKHSLLNEQVQHSELEFALEHKNSELKTLEQSLVQELTLRQQSDLAVKHLQEELKNLQELLRLQVSQQLMVDTQCQTTLVNEGGGYIDKNVGTETCETLQLEHVDLRQNMDCLSSALEDEKGNRIKAEDQVIDLQQQLTECQQNLTSCSVELKVTLVEKEKLGQKVNDLLKENENFSSKIVHLEQTNGHLSDELICLKCCLEENNMKVSVLETESEVMKNNEMKLKAEFKSVEEKNEQLFCTIKELQNRVADLQSCNLATKLELESISKMNIMLKQTESSLQEKWEHTFSSLRDRYEKSEKSLMECNQSLIESRNTYQMDICQLQQRVSELELDLLAAENLKAELSNQLKESQECSDHKDKLIKSLQDEHFVATNTEQNLGQLLEEYKEREALNVRKIILLEEKQSDYEALKTQVTSLETQHSLACKNACVARQKVQELEKRLEHEMAVCSKLSALEEELAATRAELSQADATIDQLRNQLAALDKKIVAERKLRVEVGNTVEQLSQAKNREHEFCSELLTKNNMLEMMLAEMKNSHASVLVSKPLEDDANFSKENSQIHCCQTFCLHEKAPESNTLNNMLNIAAHHDAKILEKHEPEVQLKMGHPSMKGQSSCLNHWLKESFDKNEPPLATGLMDESVSKLSQLEKVLFELQKEVDVLKSQTLQPNSVNFSPLSTAELPKQFIAVDDHHRQIELLVKELQDERKAREDTESRRSQFEQHLLEMTTLLKRIRHLHNITADVDDSVGHFSQTDMELARRQSEIDARLELNQQMKQIHKFLEEKSRAYDHLEHLHNERESQLHLEYSRVVRALQCEVRQLSERLQAREDHQRALDEQYRHLHELSEARKRVKVKLSDSAGIKKHSKYVRYSPSCALFSPKGNYTRGSSSYDYANQGCSSYVASPSLSSSPVINNNLKPMNDFRNTATDKFFDRSFAHLSSSVDNLQEQETAQSAQSTLPVLKVQHHCKLDPSLEGLLEASLMTVEWERILQEFLK